MKLALIGGGSVRTFYFVESLLKFCERLQITELSVMDNDPVKLEIFGGFAVYLAQHSDAKLSVDLTGDLKAAVKDADFVVTTLSLIHIYAQSTLCGRFAPELWDLENGGITPLHLYTVNEKQTTFAMPVSYTHLDVYKRQVM